MRITLNLATRPYADQGPALKQLRIGMAALVAVLILLGLGMMHFHQNALRMAAQEEVVDRAIAQIRSEELGYQAQMQQPDNFKVLTQAHFLNGLFEEKSFSWTAAMEDMERVLPAGVQVTAIEPARTKDGRLTLRIRIAGQRERSVQMVRNMERSKRFVAPRLSGESSENAGQGDMQSVADTGRVSFEILSEYNPATLEERKLAIAQQQKIHGRTGLGVASPAIQPPTAKAMSGRPMYVPPNPQPTVVPRAGQRQPQYPGILRGMPNGPQNHDGNRYQPPPGSPAPNNSANPGGPQ